MTGLPAERDAPGVAVQPRAMRSLRTTPVGAARADTFDGGREGRYTGADGHCDAAARVARCALPHRPFELRVPRVPRHRPALEYQRGADARDVRHGVDAAEARGGAQAGASRGGDGLQRADLPARAL